MVENKYYTVYMHVTPNGKGYVGITKQGTYKRWKKRLGYQTQKVFWRAIQKYGWDNIEHLVFARGLTHDEACQLERYLIAMYKTNDPNYGYNQTSGGDGTFDFSHPNPHSKEWRIKVGNSNRGKKRSEEAKQKMRERKLGTHWSEERRKKYSEDQKARGARPSKQCIEASVKSHRKSVCVYDIQHNFIGEYISLTEAAEKLNVSVSYMSLLASNKASYKAPKYIVEYSKKEDKNDD